VTARLNAAFRMSLKLRPYGGIEMNVLLVLLLFFLLHYYFHTVAVYRIRNCQDIKIAVLD